LNPEEQSQEVLGPLPKTVIADKQRARDAAQPSRIIKKTAKRASVFDISDDDFELDSSELGLHGDLGLSALNTHDEEAYLDPEEQSQVVLYRPKKPLPATLRSIPEFEQGQ
jgi:hypothetical protein